MDTAFFKFSEELQKVNDEVLCEIAPHLAKIEKTKEHNQLKILHSFIQNRVALTHFAGSTGYGYGDAGRDKLAAVFARVFGCEDALVRTSFASGTHALCVALFALLRPGDTMLCATGRPYDTLLGVIGLGGKTGGSLADFGIEYREIQMLSSGLDIDEISRQAQNAKILYLQRSRGYSSRGTLRHEDIKAAADAAKTANPNITIVVDNCYGEFVHKTEPTQHGAELIIGSLIKNPGGGIAPTGGYIAGKKNLVELCAQRLTAPGVGSEVGSVSGDVLRELYLGLYFAPAVTAEALKTATYARCLLTHLGLNATPTWRDDTGDIITAITMDSPEKLVAFCKGIQNLSPVDSHLTPEPAPMPGYGCDVIMASGSFTQGSSIELSCDAPMRAPYTAYMQGGLNFAAARTAVLHAAERMLQTD